MQIEFSKHQTRCGYMRKMCVHFHRIEPVNYYHRCSVAHVFISNSIEAMDSVFTVLAENLLSRFTLVKNATQILQL